MGAGPVSRGETADVAAMIDAMTRKVADFPEPGVQFKDLTPVFADRVAMAAITEALAEVAAGADLVAGIDSRGFLLAAAVATRLRTGVLAIRKGASCRPRCSARTISANTARPPSKSPPTESSWPVEAL